jgi:hypothetical protein
VPSTVQRTEPVASSVSMSSQNGAMIGWGPVVVPIAVVAALIPLPGLLQVAHLLTEATMVPIDWLASLPWAVWTQPSPPAWASLLALAGICWWRMPVGWPARWLGLAALLPVLLARPSEVQTGTAEATLLDVGHGLALVVRTASHVLVYDTGPAWSSEADAGSRIVVPYLRGEGMRRLDALVVSHDDIDHAGGAQSVLRALPVADFLSSLPAGAARQARRAAARRARRPRPARQCKLRRAPPSPQPRPPPHRWPWQRGTEAVRRRDSRDAFAAGRRSL